MPESESPLALYDRLQTALRSQRARLQAFPGRRASLLGELAALQAERDADIAGVKANAAEMRRITAKAAGDILLADVVKATAWRAQNNEWGDKSAAMTSNLVAWAEGV